MSYELYPLHRTGAEWQEIDPEHRCRYCKNRVETPEGPAMCNQLKDALHGFTFTDTVTLPSICDDYEYDSSAFSKGEGRSPMLPGFRHSYQHPGEPWNIEPVR